MWTYLLREFVQEYLQCEWVCLYAQMCLQDSDELMMAMKLLCLRGAEDEGVWGLFVRVI